MRFVKEIVIKSLHIYDCYKEISEIHCMAKHVEEATFGSLLCCARPFRSCTMVEHILVSPLIFMKIKSRKWKRVYKRRKERIKDDCLDGKWASIRIVDYLRFERKLDGFRFPPSGIASAKLDPHGRYTVDSMIFRWSRGQHTEPLSLNLTSRRGSLGFYY